jgi:DNA-binding transcriptional ArsR family regulator
METTDAVAALAALAQDNRLEIFRLLVQAGPEGVAAGHVAERLGLAPNTLSFASIVCEWRDLSAYAATVA